MPISIITLTTDVSDSTSDDQFYLPESSYYQCVSVDVDVRGPGYTYGDDVSWQVFTKADFDINGVGGTPLTTFTLVPSGGNDEILTLSTFTAGPVVTPAGDYVLVATDNADSAFTTHEFEVLELPDIVVTNPDQAYVGGKTQFTTAFSGDAYTWVSNDGVAASPGATTGSIDASTGLATWATSGLKTLHYVTGEGCYKSLEYLVHPAITVAEYNGTDCISMLTDEELQLTVGGGTGDFSYSMTGQNTVSPTGLIKSGIYAGEYTLTIIDNNAGIIINIPVCVGSQMQFCIDMESSTCEDEGVDPCCEISVDCGESVTLKVPTFHARVNGVQENIIYLDSGNGTIGEAGYLKSGSSGTSAVANEINCDSNESLFEIVTSLDMADIANDPFGIGFDQEKPNGGVDEIDVAVVWYTSGGSRKIEVRKNGVVMTGSDEPITQGDSVSAGYKNGKFVVYVNNLLKFETSDVTCCSNQNIVMAIESANKSIGGNLSGLSWAITTSGSISEVGSINADGVYVAPTDANFSIVNAEATLGNGKFRVNIRNIKPSIRFTDPNAFLAGREVEIWVGEYMPGLTEPIRLAKDGTPDAMQNPSMIDLGVLEGSASFTEQFDYQDFDDDRGTYYTSITKESAEFSGDFLEVRDLWKMSRLMPHATLYPKKNGTTEFSVGGKKSGVRELRVIMVVESTGSEKGYDVLYIPRVQNKGNLGLDIGKKGASKYTLTLTALPDFTRPAGKQLYSIYQIDNCSADSC